MNLNFDKKIIAIAILAIGLISVVVWLRPVYKTGVPEPLFMKQKLSKTNSCDVVIAGDSRVLRGVSTESFVGADDLRIHNFGFRSIALNKKFLDSAERMLDDASPKKMLLLGVTPNAFTKKSVTDNGFDSAVEDSAKLWGFVPHWWYNFERQLSPMSLSELRNIIKRQTQTGLYEIHHADGWIASDQSPDNQKQALPFYRVRFTNNQAKTELINESLDFVEQATKNGITVIGFWPPVTDEMKQTEDEKSGFDYPTYIAQFEARGGIWVSPDIAGIETYDGSHLSREAAMLFSKRLWDSVNAKMATLK